MNMFDRTRSASRKSHLSLILSVALHCGLIAGLAFVRYAGPPAPTPRLTSHIVLTAPVPALKTVPVLRKTIVRQPVLTLSTPMATFRLPARIAGPAPKISLDAAPALPPNVAPAPVIALPAGSAPAPVPQIHVGGFSETPSLSAPTPTKRDVATSGFGDAGVVGGIQVRRGVTTGAGFGDANAVAAIAVAAKMVRAGGFGDTVSVVAAAAPTRHADASPVTAAQILAKPKPAYTDEARRLQIEGEVQLEILFRASGQIDILRVVRGLGHGLDESAAQAARTIRFTPAKRDGQSVDSTATVHIIFQLAS